MGNYNWTRFDLIIESVLKTGAVPLLVVGSEFLPKGMNGDYEGSGYPSNESFGQYCASLVRHCNIEKKWDVKYWEIWNEPLFYKENQASSRTWVSLDLIADFTRTFNNAEETMRKIDPTVLCGHGNSAIEAFFDYFLGNAPNLGFFSYHDYDCGATEYYLPQYYRDEEQIMADASIVGCQEPCIWKTYSPSELVQKWYKKYGQYLPVLCTEVNMNAACENGTDPRTQTVFGASWYAEKLKALVLSNVKYSAYFVLSSDDPIYSDKNVPTGGIGFGMIDSTSPYTEFYPYWTNYLLGTRFRVGDKICCSSTTNSSVISTLAWIADSSYNFLLIGKTKNKILVDVHMKNLDAPMGATSLICTLDRNKNGIEAVNKEYSDPLTLVLDGYSLTLVIIPF
jgi:hypothetical protein